MSAPIAVIAALPREILGLIGRTRPDPESARRGIYLYRLGNVRVAAAGMGPARAALAVEACIASGSPEQLFSVGLAGACMSALRPGSLVEPSVVVDTHTGERFTADADHAQSQVLASVDAIAGIAEKARLASAYGAAVVDMEAATVARLARAQGLRFRAIKGISDGHDFELASLARFAGARGQFRTAAFAMHTAMRPHHWRPAATLGRHSKGALAAMTARILSLIAETE